MFSDSTNVKRLSGVKTVKSGANFDVNTTKETVLSSVFILNKMDLYSFHDGTCGKSFLATCEERKDYSA